MKYIDAREYRVKFVTPAFLGNGKQEAQWRTPPFKTLLRQWWRVAVARDHNYDYTAIREAEGRLFGHAWLDSDRHRDGSKVNGRKSRVQIRLTPWDKGSLNSTQWPGGQFQKVTTQKTKSIAVRSDVYLGFGPVSHQTMAPVNRALSPSQEAVLRLASRPEDMAFMERPIQLAAWFGALGSRCRNGWGSLQLEGEGLALLESASQLQMVTRGLEESLTTDWPDSIGMDSNGPLVWISEPVQRDWKAVINLLANEKVQIRSIAKTFTGPGNIGGIQLLGYPAGADWELKRLKKARLASQLRFKVLQVPEGLRAMIYHMPACFPNELLEALSNDQREWVRRNELAVWCEVRNYLDASNQLTRLA